MPGRFFQEWKSYRQQVLPASVSSVQEIETRRAFYAGGQALLAVQMKGFETASGSDEPTEDDLAIMDGLKAEFDEYLEQLKAGKA